MSDITDYGYGIYAIDAGYLRPKMAAIHLIESAIRRDRVAGVAQGLREGPFDAQLSRKQHHSRVGAPPQDRVGITEPGKNSAAIGAQQGSHGKVAASRE